MFGLQFPVVRFPKLIDFQQLLAHFQHLVFEIVGFIAPLLSILESWFTIHFNTIYVENKKRCETFSTDKWFKVTVKTSERKQFSGTPCISNEQLQLELRKALIWF